MTESNARPSFRRTVVGTLGSQRPLAGGAGKRRPFPRATGAVWGELRARGPGLCHNRPRGLCSHTFGPESVEHKHFQTRRRRDAFGDSFGVLWRPQCVLHDQGFGEPRLPLSPSALRARPRQPATRLRGGVFTLRCSDRAAVPAVPRLREAPGEGGAGKLPEALSRLFLSPRPLQ